MLNNMGLVLINPISLMAKIGKYGNNIFNEPMRVCTTGARERFYLICLW